jgi:hypothetical protein
MGTRGVAVLAGATITLGLVGYDGSSKEAKSTSAQLLNATPATSSGTAKARPRRAVENCSTRSEADFPGAFINPRNLVVGPLVLIGAGGTPEFSSGFGGQKFPLLVRNGHRLTIKLSRQTQTGAGLAYGPLPSGEVELSETHRVVRFVACRGGESSGSSADVDPVTFWSGGVLAASPRCVPLRVRIRGEPVPRHAAILLGVESC